MIPIFNWYVNVRCFPLYDKRWVSLLIWWMLNASLNLTNTGWLPRGPKYSWNSPLRISLSFTFSNESFRKFLLVHRFSRYRSIWIAYCHVAYHWEKRNKECPLPLRVWTSRPPKNDRQERNRNLGQSLAAEVINPDQNESQQMFAFCDRVKEIVVLKNRLTGEGRR